MADENGGFDQTVYLNSCAGIITARNDDGSWVITGLYDGRVQERRMAAPPKDRASLNSQMILKSALEVGMHAIAFCYRGRDFPNWVSAYTTEPGTVEGAILSTSAGSVTVEDWAGESHTVAIDNDATFEANGVSANRTDALKEGNWVTILPERPWLVASGTMPVKAIATSAGSDRAPVALAPRTPGTRIEGSWVVIDGAGAGRIAVTAMNGARVPVRPAALRTAGCRLGPLGPGACTISVSTDAGTYSQRALVTR